MKLRIAQYGWTEDRVWGVFVLILATLYTAGYAYSLRIKHGWLGNIGKTNIVTALVMCVGLVLLLSPLADARRIAVISQMNRLMSGAVEAEKIDYNYLRWEGGRYGQEALEKLAAGIEHKDKDIIASKAGQTLAQNNRYAASTGAETLTPEQIRRRLRVLPKEEVLDDALIKQRQSATRWNEKRCMETDAQCLVWMIDLNDDGLKEAVVITEKPEWSFSTANFYQHLGKDQYKYGGTINFGFGADKQQREKMMSDIESGKVKTLAPRYNDLEIGGRRINVVAEPCGNGCGG